MQIVFSNDCRGQRFAAAKRGLCARHVHVTFLTVQMELWTTPLRLYFYTDRLQVQRPLMHLLTKKDTSF